MRKGLRFLLYLILFAGIAVMAFPYVRGAIMDRRAARIAEDFLSRVIVDYFHGAYRGRTGVSGVVGCYGCLQ